MIIFGEPGLSVGKPLALFSCPSASKLGGGWLDWRKGEWEGQARVVGLDPALSFTAACMYRLIHRRR